MNEPAGIGETLGDRVPVSQASVLLLERKRVQTITGPVAAGSLGLVLPHEHLFTDLRGPMAPGYAQANPDDVASVIEPYLTSAFSAGVTALVECSTVGVGRNLAVLQRLAETSPIHIIAPTWDDSYGYMLKPKTI